jgi:transcriptional regulator with XRE-family HTH domain
MFEPIRSVEDIGLAARAVRKASDVRLDDLAATAGVSKQFTSDLEHGKPTVQLGLVLKLLNELGVRVVLDIPDHAEVPLFRLRERGLRPLKPRRNSTATGKP